jgi:hypothetical protein
MWQMCHMADVPYGGCFAFVLTLSRSALQAGPPERVAPLLAASVGRRALDCELYLFGLDCV